MFFLYIFIIILLNNLTNCFIVQKSFSSGYLFTENENIRKNSSFTEKNFVDSKNVVQYCDKKVVGYYTSWNRKKIEEKHVLRLTHVILAFIEMNPDCSLQYTLTSDKERNQKISLVIEKLVYLKKLKRKYSHLKTMFAVGGWENSQYFSKMVHDQNLIKNFVYSALNLLDIYDLDGVDIGTFHSLSQYFLLNDFLYL
jgi:GH18 family chitinase